MPYTQKRAAFGKSKGHLNVAGPQFRFIFFFLVVLIAYTLLLKVFQKLAEFMQFPVFFPIALVTLLVFLGLVGATYSHTIVGPLLRIRNALRSLVEGDANVSLRLRESDDPLLKDIVKEITLLCEHSRNANVALQETAKDLFKDVAKLQELVDEGANKAELEKHIEKIRKKESLVDREIKSFCKIS